MAQPHLEVFPSELHMLKFFGEYLPKLDVNASARLAPFLYKYDGNLVLARNLFDFLTQMEKLIGLGINTKASVQKGKSFLVFFDKKLKDAAKFSAKSGPAAQGDVITLPTTEVVELKDLVSTSIPTETQAQSTVTLHSIEEVKPIVTQVEVVDKEFTAEQLDIIAQAEALRDETKKSASKTALEEFALEKGISLSKAKTFDGMLEDLKAAL